MIRSKIIGILSVCILIVACKKREYPDEKVQLEKENIFCSGYIGNEAIDLKIGKDGYYCYSSYTQRPDSIYIFEAALKKYNCNPCPLSLQVQISDYIKRLPGSGISIDSSFRKGSRNFIPAASKFHKMRFEAHSNKEVSFLHWNLSNGTTSQDSILICEFGQTGIQTVSLTVRAKDNCESMVVNKIFVGGESGLFASGITAQLTQNTGADFKSTIIGGKAPYRYTWDFGDGTSSNLSTPSHTYAWTGSYPVKLRIEDAENNTCESNYIFVTGNDLSSCASNMTLSYLGSRNALLNGVKIQWTDQSNIVLSSDNIDQPAESYFEILNSEAYAANERGEPGRLLSLRFNVLLSDGTRKLWFKSENAAIAVTYK